MWSYSTLHRYLDTDTDTRYVDTPIRHFFKITDTGIHEYIYNRNIIKCTIQKSLKKVIRVPDSLLFFYFITSSVIHPHW
jgi:hypothetical protein